MKTPSFLISSLLAAVGAAVLLVAPAAAQTASSQGRIVFQSSADGDWDIYTMAADGTDIRNLTSDGETGDGWIDTQPSWSPDGTRIAFVSNRGGTGTDIFVMNADGSRITRVTNNGPDDPDLTPDWSADGTQIVFAGRREAERTPEMGEDDLDIYVTDADGTGDEVNLSDPEEIEFDDFYPDWAPDGSLIVFEGTVLTPYEIEGEPHEGGFHKIITMEPDGSNRTVVSAVQDPGNDENPDAIPNHDRAPSWSPNSEWIAFFTEQMPEDDKDLQIVRRDGTDQTNITPDYFASDSFPTWSPDGREIVFTSNRGDWGVDLFTIDVTAFTGERGAVDAEVGVSASGASSPEIRQLTDGQGATEPDWQRAGCTIEGTVAADRLVGTHGADVICGRRGEDVLKGLSNEDRVLGGRGDDVLLGGKDADDFIGGMGSDTVSYADAPQGVTVSLSQRRAWGEGRDRLAAIENARGSQGDDLLVGSAGRNRLLGRSGGDDVSGRRGDDLLRGGLGADELNGGGGFDRCPDPDRDTARTSCNG